MQKRFNKEYLTLEKLQEVRSKYNLAKDVETELSLEEEDLLMLGEDGIETLSIPETEKEIEILNDEISEGYDLIEKELAKIGIYPDKVKLVNESDQTTEELSVMDFSMIESDKLQRIISKVEQRTTTGTTTSHVNIGTYPTSTHTYDGVTCIHSQLGYLSYVDGVSYIPVYKSATSDANKAYIVAKIYPYEYFTYMNSTSSNKRTQIKIQNSNGIFTTGYVENKFAILEGINSYGNYTGGTATCPVGRAELWIKKTYGWVQKIGGKKQPLFKNYYSTNNGLPIYDGGKNQIGKRVGLECYVSGRIGAKAGDSMKNWLQIQYYQTSTELSPQGKNTFYSAGSNHPYFVSTGIDSNSRKPFIRVKA